MSTITLMSGAEKLKSQIISLAENGEAYKAFLISHALYKIAEGLKKEYQPQAVEYWQRNKELPVGYKCKESSRREYAFEQDAKWQLLKAQMDAREAILKQSADVKQDVFDELGEIVPKVHKKESSVYSFSQK